MVKMLQINYTRYANGIWRAYFDGLPRFYGEGNTKEEALQQLKEKLLLVLEAIGKIQRGE